MPAFPRLCALALCVFSISPVVADDGKWLGVAVSEYIAHMVDQDLAIIYSSDLVSDDYTVLEEPSSPDPYTALQEVLRPYGLVVKTGPGNGLLIVQLADRSGIADGQGDIAASGADEALPEVIVSSSLYAMHYQQSGSHTFLDRDLTTKLPDVGDEAIRGIDRLPGIASGGLSTRSHIRGGANNEQLLIFDGLRLYEPYHLKDFHSVSTIIDQNAIAGIDFYSAGYQARYGDRMSGVIDISRRDPPSETETELGLSFFNASLLSLGRFGNNDRGDWMFSVRRGNLDLITKAVNPDYGVPRYQDLLAHVGWELGARTSVSANGLFSYDKVTISQVDDSEQATAQYRNRAVWLKAETDWTGSVFSSTILSETKISNFRDGQTVNPGIMTGSVADSRDFRSVGLKQDWRFDVSGSLLFRTGFDVRELRATYLYDSTLTIFPPFDQILDNVPILARSIDVSPRGAQYAAYLETRWRVTDDLVLDLGVRWDQQTYTTANIDDQVSPRFNLLYRIGDKTELRFGYGQFYQAQEINELPVGDGEIDYGPAQHARHLVTSLSHSFGQGIDLRLEVYQKKYGSLIPRFENAFDPLVLIPELQIDRVRIEADNATARGAEIMLTGEHRNSGVLWWLSHAWSLIEDELPEGDVRRSWDQRHTAKAGINWDWNRWSFSAAGSIHTGWPKTSLMAETISDPDGLTSLLLDTTPRNSEQHTTFHALDIRASRRFSVRRGELIGFVEVSNLYNRRNLCCTQYSLGADDTGNSIVIAKDGAWLPLVPSLGIIWQF